MVTNSGRLARAATATSSSTERSASAWETGRTVSEKRSRGATGKRFPSERDSKTFLRRLSVCVEFHGGHDGRIAKAERPSAAPPNFSQLSARECTAVGSQLSPIEKNRDPGDQVITVKKSPPTFVQAGPMDPWALMQKALLDALVL